MANVVPPNNSRSLPEVSEKTAKELQESMEDWFRKRQQGNAGSSSPPAHTNSHKSNKKDKDVNMKTPETDVKPDYAEDNNKSS